MPTENLTKLQLLLDTGSVGEGSLTPLSISELHGDKKKRSDLGIDEPSGLGLVSGLGLPYRPGHKNHRELRTTRKAQKSQKLC